MKTLPILAAALMLATTFPGVAQEASGGRVALGHLTYRLSCAICHGPDGTGNGGIANDLSVAPPNLTRLAARNGGTFPTEWVTRVIRGGAGVTEHGGQMPAWGLIFLKDFQERGGSISAEALVKQRIADLIAYLESIQTR